jgi:hypothetical protein
MLLKQWGVQARARLETLHAGKKAGLEQMRKQLDAQLADLEKQKLKDFASPTALRVSEGANDLDLSTPLASSNPAINRAFASLAKAAGTPPCSPR